MGFDPMAPHPRSQLGLAELVLPAGADRLHCAEDHLLGRPAFLRVYGADPATVADLYEDVLPVIFMEAQPAHQLQAAVNYRFRLQHRTHIYPQLPDELSKVYRSLTG